MLPCSSAWFHSSFGNGLTDNAMPEIAAALKRGALPELVELSLTHNHDVSVEAAVAVERQREQIRVALP